MITVLKISTSQSYKRTFFSYVHICGVVIQVRWSVTMKVKTFLTSAVVQTLLSK